MQYNKGGYIAGFSQESQNDSWLKLLKPLYRQRKWLKFLYIVFFIGSVGGVIYTVHIWHIYEVYVFGRGGVFHDFRIENLFYRGIHLTFFFQIALLVVSTYLVFNLGHKLKQATNVLGKARHENDMNLFHQSLEKFSEFFRWLGISVITSIVLGILRFLLYMR